MKKKVLNSPVPIQIRLNIRDYMFHSVRSREKNLSFQKSSEDLRNTFWELKNLDIAEIFKDEKVLLELSNKYLKEELARKLEIVKSSLLTAKDYSAILIDQLGGAIAIKKRGRKRKDRTLSLEVLSCMYYLQDNGYEKGWFKQFMQYDGPLHAYVRNIFFNKLYEAPEVPFVNNSENKLWFSELKKTLERSVFSEEKVSKKTEDFDDYRKKIKMVIEMQRYPYIDYWHDRSRISKRLRSTLLFLEEDS